MKRFTENDIFYNTLLTNPKYTIVMQSGSLRINDQINQNQEKSSSISLMELSGTYKYQTYTGSYQYSSSINRELIYKISSSGKNTYRHLNTKYSTLLKVAGLKNIFWLYKNENEYADIDYYLENNGVPYNEKPPGSISFNTSSANLRAFYHIRPTSSINLIEIPSIFYGNYIKPGSITMNMYISGNLTASCQDIYKNGKLFQTTGNGSGSVVGSIFYDHGIILLTGSTNLSSQQAPYLQPLLEYTSAVGATPSNDYLKWIYFGTQVTTGSQIETKYELIFQGANFIPTLTMMCHAEKDELWWSNNRTFIQSGQGNKIFYGQTGSAVGIDGTTYYADSGSILVPSSKILKENKEILIKNTISSSFVHYSASYDPQVFISQIGIYDENRNLIAIAKLANPVRKTKDLDYTFKLKLDM